MNAALHGSVFRRHSESIPAHRVQHIETPGSLVPGNDVAHRVVADMAHVNAARRIGEHFEHVIFFARIGIVGLEDLRLVPFLLPAGLGVARIITFGGHGIRISGKSGEVGRDLHHETAVASSFAGASNVRSFASRALFRKTGLGKNTMRR